MFPSLAKVHALPFFDHWKLPFHIADVDLERECSGFLIVDGEVEPSFVSFGIGIDVEVDVVLLLAHFEDAIDVAALAGCFEGYCLA